jgi:hypothetical protein
MNAHDHVFHSDGWWYCIVDGRVFGAWVSRAIALAGMKVEQRRAERRRK